MATHLTAKDLNTPDEYLREIRTLIDRALGALYLHHHDEATVWTDRAEQILVEFNRRQRTHGYWPEPAPATLVDTTALSGQIMRIRAADANHI